MPIMPDLSIIVATVAYSRTYRPGHFNAHFATGHGEEKDVVASRRIAARNVDMYTLTRLMIQMQGP